MAYTGSCWSLEGYFKFYNFGFSNNTCILIGDTGYSSTGGISNHAPPGHNNCGTAQCCPRCCGGVSKSFTDQVGSNVVATPSGDLQVCHLNFTDWQKAGNDPHTVVAKWPADPQLTAQVRALLAF